MDARTRKIARIKALLAGATTEGERMACIAALARLGVVVATFAPSAYARRMGAYATPTFERRTFDVWA